MLFRRTNSELATIGFRCAAVAAGLGEPGAAWKHPSRQQLRAVLPFVLARQAFERPGGILWEEMMP